MRIPPRGVTWLWRCFGLAVGLFGASAAIGQESSRATSANVMVEIAFTARQTWSDPFNDVTLDVVFTDPSGHEARVPAFWAGGNRWKVRYASPIAGRHTFRTVSVPADDAGLHDVRGSVEVAPYRGDNPFFRHGPLQVSPNRRFLQHRDGTPFFWLGDTWWMGLCDRLKWPEDVQTLAADRKAKGFNVIQIVAGLYPDMPPFDERGANEAGFPWEKDFSRIRPEYFDAADHRLLYLVEQGFSPCVVGAWGYFIPLMTPVKAKQHWRYLIARYGALPVVWCVAGEANLPYYLAPGFPYDDRQQVEGWTEVARYVRALDPFHRLITIHPTGIGRLSARNAINDVSLLDIDLLQTPHAQRSAVAPTVRTVRTSYVDTPTMPIINGEPAYEMLNDTLPTEWSRQMFWLCLMNGAAGHTYGANGIWQVNRPGRPHGPSPNGQPGSPGYGLITWEQAMRLPGSQQVAYGRDLLVRHPWTEFTPHPEWAEFADRSWFDFAGSQWIGASAAKAAAPVVSGTSAAPVDKRWLRRVFSLPAGKVVSSAHVFVAADRPFSARLNKRSAGSGEGGSIAFHHYDLSTLLRPGRNALGVALDVTQAEVGTRPALIVRLEVRFADGEKLSIYSDSSWRSHAAEVAGWDTPEFDDAAWDSAVVLDEYGGGRRARVARPDSNDIFGPQSAGVADRVRITYVPQPAAIRLVGLPAGVSYESAYFDPVKGTTTPLGPLVAQSDGNAVVSPPENCDHDWVLVLQATRRAR